MKDFLLSNVFRIWFLIISVQFIDEIVGIIHVRDAWNVIGVILAGLGWISSLVLLLLPKKVLNES